MSRSASHRAAVSNCAISCVPSSFARRVGTQKVRISPAPCSSAGRQWCPKQTVSNGARGRHTRFDLNPGTQGHESQPAETRGNQSICRTEEGLHGLHGALHVSSTLPGGVYSRMHCSPRHNAASPSLPATIKNKTPPSTTTPLAPHTGLIQRTAPRERNP